MIADELRRQADVFIDLTQLQEQICRGFGGQARGGQRSGARKAPAEDTYEETESDEEDEDDEEYYGDDPVYQQN
jgi:hypothetical protein